MSTKRSSAHGPYRRAGSLIRPRVSYAPSPPREPLLAAEVRALENRLNRLLERTTKMRSIEGRLNELLQQQAARAAEIRAMEQAVERLLGRLSGLSAILTAKTFPVPDSIETTTTPSHPVLRYNCGSQPSRRIDTALGQWLVARYKHMYRGRVRP